MKAKDTKRGEDQSTLTISLPKLLKARIKEAAAGETRSVSNWCVLQLEKLVKQPAESPAAAAEPVTKPDQAKTSRAG